MISCDPFCASYFLWLCIPIGECALALEFSPHSVWFHLAGVIFIRLPALLLYFVTRSIVIIFWTIEYRFHITFFLVCSNGLDREMYPLGRVCVLSIFRFVVLLLLRFPSSLLLCTFGKKKYFSFACLITVFYVLNVRYKWSHINFNDMNCGFFLAIGNWITFALYVIFSFFSFFCCLLILSRFLRVRIHTHTHT